MDLAKLDPELLRLDLVGDDERSYRFVERETVFGLKQLRPAGGVLSVYLGIAQGAVQKQPTMSRFAQGVEAVRQTHEAGWSHDEKVAFDLLVKDLGERLERMLARPRGRGIAMFASPSRVLPKKEKVDYEIFCSFSLPHPPPDLALWGESPMLTPLLVLRDENPETGVVLFDREQVRFFLCFMGEAAEYDVGMENEDAVPLTKSHVWHGYGEHNHHQWQEEHYRRYWRRAGIAVDKVARKAQWKWLVLASPDQQEAGRLLDHLPGALREKVIGTTTLSMQANLNDVREQVTPLIRAAELEEERAVLESWDGELQRAEGRAVAGTAETALAAQECRIHTLIADEEFVQKGWRCGNCGGLVADLVERLPAGCPYCGSGELVELADIIAETALQVIDTGGEVEIVHDPGNRERVKRHGGVGGLLRY